MGNSPNLQRGKQQAVQPTNQPQYDFSEFNRNLAAQSNPRDDLARLHEAAMREIQGTFGELHVIYLWFSWKRLLIYLPGTALMWCLSMFVVAITDFGDQWMWGRLFIVIPLLSLALWGTYRILAVLLNQTIIEIESGILSVRHRPLPYPGNLIMPCHELKEVRTQQISKTGVPFFFGSEGGSVDLTPRASFYQLQAVHQNGREFILVVDSDEPTIRSLEAAITRQANLGKTGMSDVVRDIPAGLEAQQDFGRLTVTYRWFSWRTIFPHLMTTLFGLGTIVISMWISGDRNAAAESSDFFIRFAPLIGLLMAVGGGYMTVATMLNRTVIDISSDRIGVRHGPLPYPGNRSLACADLQQMAVVEREHKSDEPATYQLKATLKTGESLTLWSNAKRERLDYLKQAIEQQSGRTAS